MSVMPIALFLRVNTVVHIISLILLDFIVIPIPDEVLNMLFGKYPLLLYHMRAISFFNFEQRVRPWPCRRGISVDVLFVVRVLGKLCDIVLAQDLLVFWMEIILDVGVCCFHNWFLKISHSVVNIMVRVFGDGGGLKMPVMLICMVAIPMFIHR